MISIMILFIHSTNQKQSIKSQNRPLNKFLPPLCVWPIKVTSIHEPSKKPKYSYIKNRRAINNPSSTYPLQFLNFFNRKTCRLTDNLYIYSQILQATGCPKLFINLSLFVCRLKGIIMVRQYFIFSLEYYKERKFSWKFQKMHHFTNKKSPYMLVSM